MDIFGNFSKLKGDKSKRKLEMAEELDFAYSDNTLIPIGKVEHKDSFTLAILSKSILMVFFLIIISRLFYLQVVQGSDNEKLAQGNSIRPRIIEASRGLITDDKGTWLARNKPDFALAVYPSDLPRKKAEREEAIKKIAMAVSMPYEDVAKLINQQGNYFLDSVVLKDNISHDDALLLEEKTAGLPGISIALKSSREYAVLPGIAHILGYTGQVSEQDLKNHPDYFHSDKVGKTGLEKTYEDNLRGTPGIEQVEVDSKGNIIRTLVDTDSKQPIAGKDISLYLDRDLQQKVADALKAGIENAKTLTGNQDISAGVAIVEDVNTGGILSMVSLPDYDDNLFSTGISNADYQKLANDKSMPLFNRAIAGTYPPGSISKIILASAGLSEGNITPNTAFSTPAAIKIGEYTFPDWKDHSYESTNIERAIAESNNVFFYSIGGGYEKIKGLGIQKIKKWWQLFGLGAPTGIDLPGEASGLLPDNDWKQKARNEPWYLGDTYHVSIGQGDLLITPLQMLNATATIANGGKLLKPQLVKKVTDPAGNVVKEFGPQVVREGFMSPEVVKTVQEGMRLTITGGSARNLSDLPVSVAGKTGTAQFFNNEKTHAWFEAYAPYENPQIAILVMIEGGGGGHEVAAPIAKDILNYFFTR